MRLYLFPITRSRTLIYCKRTNPLALPSASSDSSTTGNVGSADTQSNSAPKSPLLDRVTARASSAWVSWESAPSGWKKTVTTWGNQLFARIPYTEWGLKSIPPLSKARREQSLLLSSIPRSSPSASDAARRRSAEVDVVYPRNLLRDTDIKSLLSKIAKENKGAYRKKMWWSMVAMPFTAPFALVPVVPNLPFFFLVFRAWSYWRAGSGCAHIEFLLERDLLNLRSSEVLQKLWNVRSSQAKIEELEHRISSMKRDKTVHGADEVRLEPEDDEVEKVAMDVLARETSQSQDIAVDTEDEQIYYSKGHGKLVGLALNMPEVDVELERAHDQVLKELLKDTKAAPSRSENGKDK